MNEAAGKEGGASRTGDETSWHSLDGAECADKLGVDPATGLGAAEAAGRLDVYGLNQLAGGKKRPLWLAFLLQYRPQMQMVLVGAAVVSALIGNVSTMGVLIGVTVLNAVLGMLQESKAQRSVDALKDLLVQEAHARRDGNAIAIPAAAVASRQRVMHINNDPAVAQTTALAVFAVAQSSLALSLRFSDLSVFRREALSNPMLSFAIAWNVGAMLLVTELPLLRDLFHATPLNARQWGLCLLMSVAILLLGEAAKPLLKLIPRTESS